MSLFNIFLIIHVAGGTIGLVVGSYIMFAKKGNRLHKKLGKIFAYSMLGAGICSLALSVLHWNPFLFSVGIFTIYLASTGWRYLYLKKIASGQKAMLIDWVLMAFMFAGSIAFVIVGVRIIFYKQYFGFVMLLFAWRGFLFVINDYKTYKRQIATKNYWLTFHLQRMVGAYIAALTAFAAVNAPQRFSILPWVLPAALLVPLIMKWTKKYKVKLAIS